MYQGWEVTPLPTQLGASFLSQPSGKLKARILREGL